MISRFRHVRLAIGVVLSAGLWLGPGGPAKAVNQEAPSLADRVAKLKTDPAGVFQGTDGNTLAIGALISTVRDMTIAEKSALPPIVQALKLGTRAQRSAIGTALGQAAQSVIRTDPSYAAEIQQVVAQSGDQDAILAFAAVTGNAPIGATSAGSGGAGGAVGAGGGGGSVGASSGSGSGSGGGAAGGGGGSVGTTFTASSAITTTLTTTTTTTVTNAARSVSP